MARAMKLFENQFLLSISAEGDCADGFLVTFRKMVDFVQSDHFREFKASASAAGVEVVPRFSIEKNAPYNISFNWRVDLLANRGNKIVCAKDDPGYQSIMNAAFNLVNLVNSVGYADAGEVNHSGNVVPLCKPDECPSIKFSLYQMTYREDTPMSASLSLRPEPSDYFKRINLLGDDMAQNRFVKQVGINDVSQKDAIETLEYFVGLVENSELIPSSFSETQLDMVLDVALTSATKANVHFSAMTPLHFTCITSVDFNSGMFKELLDPFITFFSHKDHRYHEDQFSSYLAHQFCFGLDIVENESYGSFVDYDPELVNQKLGPFNYCDGSKKAEKAEIVQLIVEEFSDSDRR